MDVAGVVIGSLALLLSVLASALAGVQVKREFDFRKPLFKVTAAELEGRLNAGAALVGPGKIQFRVRGANSAITLTSWQLGFNSTKNVFQGTPEQPFSVNLPIRAWTSFSLRLDSPLTASVGTDRLPATVDLVAPFTTPDTVYRTTMRLHVTNDSRYVLPIDVKRLRAMHFP